MARELPALASPTKVVMGEIGRRLSGGTVGEKGDGCCVFARIPEGPEGRRWIVG